MRDSRQKSEQLDELVAQLEQLAAQAAAAEPLQSADQSCGTLRRMFLVSEASVLVAVLIGVIGVNIWHRNSSNSTRDATASAALVYSTSDAAVSGTIVTIAPPLPGTVDQVFAQVGSRVQAGDLIATVKSIPGAIMHIKSPIAGTIVDEGATTAEVLGAGTPLARVIDLDNLFITAYVDEGHIGDIHPNESVDIRVAAVPGVTYHGRVMRILPVTAGTFGPSPGTDYADGNVTKVSRRIPVQISLEGNQGKQLYPGGSAKVTIHIH